jgi:hypothetical protein
MSRSVTTVSILVIRLILSCAMVFYRLHHHPELGLCKLFKHFVDLRDKTTLSDTGISQSNFGSTYSRFQLLCHSLLRRIEHRISESSFKPSVSE